MWKQFGIECYNDMTYCPIAINNNCGVRERCDICEDSETRKEAVKLNLPIILIHGKPECFTRVSNESEFKTKCDRVDSESGVRSSGGKPCLETSDNANV